LTKKKERERET